MMRPALSPSRSPSCSPSCKQQLRGFTVLEASISLIIAEIIFFTAVATWALIVPALRRNATVAEESARAGLITERITLDIQNAGGGGIPPHNAIVVEKACAARTRSGTNYLPACPVGDRITIANAVAGPSTCRVSQQVSDTRLEFFDLNNVCCFPDVGGADPFLRHVMLRDDDTYELAYLRATGSDCLFDVTPLRDSLSQASSLPSLQWQDAVLVDVKSYMLDTQAGAKDPRLHQLIVHSDIDGDPTTFEKFLIANDVVDLRFDVMTRSGSAFGPAALTAQSAIRIRVNVGHFAVAKLTESPTTALAGFSNQ